MANFSNGDIVKAIAGREKEKLFIVYDIHDNFAYLVNGKSRPIENPKKKNIKHLFLLCKSEYTRIDPNDLTNSNDVHPKG